MHNERCTSGSGRGQAKPVVVKLPRRACSTLPYLPLVNGEWAYLGAWMDLYSRQVVSWRVDDNMEDALVIVPLRAALQIRQPAKGLIVHSDRGGQYVSNDLHELVSLWRIRTSMSRAAPRWPTILTTMRLQSRSGVA
jgi:transposase InsO family protein